MTRNRFEPVATTWRQNGKWETVAARRIPNGWQTAVETLPIRYSDVDLIGPDDHVLGGPDKLHYYPSGSICYVSDRIADELRKATFPLLLRKGPSDGFEAGEVEERRSFGERIVVEADPAPAEVTRVHEPARSAVEVRLQAHIDQLETALAEQKAENERREAETAAQFAALEKKPKKSTTAAPAAN